MKKNVLLVFGGRSAEHEISLLSARNVAAALDRKKFDPILVGISQQGAWFRFPDENIFTHLKTLSEKNLPAGAEACSLITLQGKPYLYLLKSMEKIPLEIAFPIMHGPYGEDGSVQGLFRMMNLAYVGCGLFGSSAGMDKEVMKRIFKEAGIPTARYQLLTASNPSSYKELAKSLGATFFIKPANMGSSVGVHKIKNDSDFSVQLKDSFLYDHKVLAEEFIQGREIECSVMGHNHSPQASTCGEVIAAHEFYSYEAKYLDEKGAALKIPADISPDTLRKIQELACKTFQVMGCEGLTRVDFFLQNNGQIMVNEINTIPGFTKISMYPMMWQASGLGYTELISRLLELGLEKFHSDQSLQMHFPGA